MGEVLRVTSQELRILRLLQAHSLEDSSTRSAEDRGTLSSLKAKQWVRLYVNGGVVITDLGLAALAAEEERLAKLKAEAEQKTKQEAYERHKEKKDARRSWAQMFIPLLVNVLVSLFTFFLGAYLAGQTSFLNWFLSVFR